MDLLVPGKGIQNAIVAVRGRSTVLSQVNGNFSFYIPGQTFALDSVSKKGYKLVDADAAPKNYRYSANPLYLLMETPDQQLQDKLDAERKIRRTLQKQLLKREKEIEAMNITLKDITNTRTSLRTASSKTSRGLPRRVLFRKNMRRM